MAKFNIFRARPAGTSPVATAPAPSGRTYEGGDGYARDTKSELFLLAVSNMGGEATFYESGGQRDNRFAELVHTAALADPEWTARLLKWLRSEANMRTASLVGAAEFVFARLVAESDAGVTNRAVIDSVLQRADEPGELLAYWTGANGRRVPKPIKRGIADAVKRLYDERAVLKWDSDARGFRMADVLNLAHPSPAADWQGSLFQYMLDRRRDSDVAVPDALRMTAARRELMAWPVEQRRALFARPDAADVLRRAGMTWESVAGWLQGPLTKEVWEALAPSMGYMACLAEGTPVWLADGTTAPIEDVVARRLPVLSYDKAWDTRPVKYGANQGPRDHSVGRLIPTVPSAWLDTGVRPVVTIRFASGRTVDATTDHRWIRQRRTGRQAWEWTTSDELRPGDRIPAPLTAGYFGDEGDAWDGYFVGAMLGDGGMTALTPEFHGDPDDGAVTFMREYAAKHDCRVTETANGRIVRLRFPFKQWKRNPLAEILRAYDVWGKRCEVKSLPNRPFSREFWIGALSGLIDTDGCVRERVNPKGTVHGTVEYATVSRRLAEQVSDALLRLGVTNIVRERAPQVRSGRIQSRHPLHIVEVNRATAVVRLASLLDLRIGYKATKLAQLAEQLAHVAPASSDMHGYDEAVALDRVVSVEDGGERPTYCVTVEPSNVFVAAGLVTGNCLRNLRNFDEAGMSDEVAAAVAARLADPGQVARSRQFPFRFLSAYEAAPSLRWGHALDQALQASLSNLPALPGRSLILIDTSASMTHGTISAKSKVTPAKAAAVFGVALGAKGEQVDVVGFADGTFRHDIARGASVIRTVGRFLKRIGEVGHGTDITGSLKRAYRGHDRVFIISDMQTIGGHYGQGVSDVVPSHVPIYGFNLGGYQKAAYATGKANRHEFGGLTDATFRMVPLLEAGRNADWPF
ncbi:LAGLIDADG family homing endonuclease [Lentzea sp. BCCO 10_0856]|uniref:LAGLIDADG family homing endonuclease n=1 Tax=Lentzea miocenica TaxID=3095431 RepID=A0ABU4SZ92_9PSEU|nr:LAGLIDADG family homing endonuclease [Lentzea sp. BCCO 10_0856]MDX8031229.1 LAGLIDADG family homing endonuclease [Lentzea sp. BCCO 10_0856]